MKTSFSLIPLFLGASLSAQELTAEPSQESLSPILMFVADRPSADAAAPRIRALIERVGAERVYVDSYDLQLLRSTGCFGSADLQAVMNGFITGLSNQEVAELRPFLAVCSDMCLAMNDLTETLNETAGGPRQVWPAEAELGKLRARPAPLQGPSASVSRSATPGV